MNRRQFLVASAQAAVAARGEAPKTRLGLVHSTHRRLRHPASPEDPLDYARVRDMVWKAIEYAGSPRIRRASWVVVKPNIVSLRPRVSYRTGDITDIRVTRAVMEYVAARSGAARVTLAEGGSYRNLRDPVEEDAVKQDGRRVDAMSFDWGAEEFPGFTGSMGGMLRDLGRGFPGKKFDYIDLSYDAVRDASGQFQRIEVPKAANGVGASSGRPDYFVTNTVRNCDFLITVPVMKVHTMCGLTACLKNYVGTAPREAYRGDKGFSNGKLHEQHSVEGRIDHFIADLAAFHPPDYCVVDGIRGLQYQEHGNGRPDQMVRNNLVLAGLDPVATDALAAHLLGYNEWDIEYLHLAAKRGMGTFDLGRVEVVGDEPDRLRRRWEKPRGWFGRANREWLMNGKRHTAPTDTLKSETSFEAQARVRSDGQRKAYLWVGARGRVTATLNGETVMKEENRTRYRIGQFQKAVELRPGENLLSFRVEALTEAAQLSALLVGPRNDGDTVEGIRWL